MLGCRFVTNHLMWMEIMTHLPLDQRMTFLHIGKNINSFGQILDLFDLFECPIFLVQNKINNLFFMALQLLYGFFRSLSLDNNVK